MDLQLVFSDVYNEYLDFESTKFSKKSDFIECFGNQQRAKKMFVCDEVFGVITYDSGMSYKIGNIIIEVMSAILNGQTYEYVEDGENHLRFLYVVNLLIEKGYKIDWGTNITGCWFEEGENWFRELVKFVEG